MDRVLHLPRLALRALGREKLVVKGGAMSRPLVLPSKKTLVAYARALAKAQTPLQLELLEQSYEKHLAGDVGALEVLGLLKLWIGAALASSAGGKCINCQRSEFEAARDNDGGYYMGCRWCTIVIPPEVEDLINAKRTDGAGGDRGAAFSAVRAVRSRLPRARREPVRELDQPAGETRLLLPGKRDD